ncbi:MAG: hypothetical protein AABX12_00385 [Nanoarchaeota archaeon]
MEEKVIVDVEKFVLFHKNRIALLKEFAKNKAHGKLIFQISFLGFESLAGLLYPRENDSSKRFIELLSTPNVGIERNKATELYNFWRNSLIHQGFIAYPWTTLEVWSEYDIAFLSYPENKLRSSVEYPPESIIAIYENLIDYLDNFFKKTNTKKIEF